MGTRVVGTRVVGTRAVGTRAVATRVVVTRAAGIARATDSICPTGCTDFEGSRDLAVA